MNLASALSAVPVLIVVWGIITACFVGLLTYRAQLTRYEDDQLFLAENDAVAVGERRHGEIVRRIRQLEPFVRIFGGAAALVTVGIVGIWFADAWRTIH